MSRDAALDNIISKRRQENLVPRLGILKCPDHEPHFPGNIEIVIRPHEVPASDPCKGRLLKAKGKVSIEMLLVKIPRLRVHIRVLPAPESLRSEPLLNGSRRGKQPLMAVARLQAWPSME